MDWFVDAVGVPASIGSGTGKEEETCRPPESEVPPGVVWEEPKNRRKEAGSEEKSNRRWVSVLVAQFALERGKTQHHHPILRTFREIGCVVSLTLVMERAPPQRRPASPHRPPRRRCRQVKTSMASYRRKR